MTIPENDFFRETTLRLCRTLDMQEALYDCSEYIRQFVPFSNCSLSLYSDQSLSCSSNQCMII
jgi:hypothetical protein